MEKFKRKFEERRCGDSGRRNSGTPSVENGTHSKNIPVGSPRATRRSQKRRRQSGSARQNKNRQVGAGKRIDDDLFKGKELFDKITE